MKNDFANEIGAAAAKASVPGSVVVASAAGWGVQEWMYAATLVYVIAQLGYLLWKWVHEWRAKRKAIRDLARRMDLDDEG